MQNAKQIIHSSAYEERKSTSELIDSLPATRFYGSKRRIVRWIYDQIKDLKFHSVLDAFGGTASVSLMFKGMRKKVFYHDALLFNTISAQFLLSDRKPFANEQAVNEILEKIVPVDGFVTNTFKGMYFTNEENRWLDGAAVEICKLRDTNKVKALIYSIGQAALQKRPFNLFHRANLNIRTATGYMQSFGNKTTWETPFDVLAYRAYESASKCIYESEFPVSVLSPVDVSDLTPGYDLVYLDPPYINPNRSSDSYLKKYHFLEGYSRYEKWNELLDESSRIKSLKEWPHITKWNKRSEFRDLLYGLIDKHSDSIVVLSYVTEAYPSIEEIKKFFCIKFSSVRIASTDLSHALSKGKKSEVLIIGVP